MADLLSVHVKPILQQCIFDLQQKNAKRGSKGTSYMSMSSSSSLSIRARTADNKSNNLQYKYYDYQKSGCFFTRQASCRRTSKEAVPICMWARIISIRLLLSRCHHTFFGAATAARIGPSSVVTRRLTAGVKIAIQKPQTLRKPKTRGPSEPADYRCLLKL